MQEKKTFLKKNSICLISKYNTLYLLKLTYQIIFYTYKYLFVNIQILIGLFHLQLRTKATVPPPGVILHLQISFCKHTDSNWAIPSPVENKSHSTSPWCYDSAMVQGSVPSFYNLGYSAVPQSWTHGFIKNRYIKLNMGQ